MLLYLVQHGKARDRDEDPDRPLTDEGRREVETVMLVLMRYGAITASRVVHSGKRRAAETAELIALKLDADVEEADGLGPTDDPETWAGRLQESNRDLVMVGHLPHLSRLASRLLTGDPEASVVSFANGGVVALGRADGEWSVKWAIPPALVQE